VNPWEDARVQRGMTAQLAKRRKRIAAGEKPLGWKMGFGAPTAMKKLDIDAPLIGYLMHGALLQSGATVNVTGWTQLVVEPEIGARLVGDIGRGSTPATARSAIASLEPVIELADLNLAATAENIDVVLSGDIYQRHVMLGSWRRDGGDTTGLVSRVTRRGKLADETSDPQALTGKIPELLVHLADTLDAFGEKLRGGDLVICGSTVPPALIEPDELEYFYELSPIGAVSAHFTRA
jgi:2-keto-4-pentenoate hydratase